MSRRRTQRKTATSVERSTESRAANRRTTVLVSLYIALLFGVTAVVVVVLRIT